ncbi:hypothetical protein UFOVP398_43 [uncultured Caudovirales phage]|uniref:DUF7448 domain-containing protein n=1 Tax=uncultured Caudovirales phage TaxID=2100421 RepID=A0A6J5M9T3_9CAUD|nr:hypothetical protein UFOVP398_43 [uncultured Caudovirales phage]
MTAPRPTLHLRPMSELTSEHGTVIIFHTPEIYGTCTLRTIARCEETLPDFIEGLIGCCETVDILSIDGDPAWLIGKPLIVAEIVDNVDQPPTAIYEDAPYEVSYTWTFVKLGTNAGVITVRWFGSSNGYYCERPQTSYYPAEAAQ